MEDKSCLPGRSPCLGRAGGALAWTDLLLNAALQRLDPHLFFAQVGIEGSHFRFGFASHLGNLLVGSAWEGKKQPRTLTQSRFLFSPRLGRTQTPNSLIQLFFCVSFQGLVPLLFLLNSLKVILHAFLQRLFILEDEIESFGFHRPGQAPTFPVVFFNPKPSHKTILFV